MKNLFFVAVIAFSVVGCVTAPQQHTFEKSRTFSKSKTAVWENLMDFFTQQNIQIKTIEKESGVIYAELSFFTPGLSADCGKNGLARVTGTSASFNVFVREKGAEKVTVTVNSKFMEGLRFGDNYWTIECNSTGHIEKQILNSL